MGKKKLHNKYTTLFYFSSSTGWRGRNEINWHWFVLTLFFSLCLFSHECRNLRVCYPGCSFHWLSNSAFKVHGRTHKRKNNVVFSPSFLQCVCFLFQRTERKALVTESLPVPLTNHTRQARSAPAPPSGQLQSESAQNSLSQLLARLLSRKSEWSETCGQKTREGNCGNCGLDTHFVLASLSRSCCISPPDIRLSAGCRHSRWARTLPSGISHLPLASALHCPVPRSCLFHNRFLKSYPLTCPFHYSLTLVPTS